MARTRSTCSISTGSICSSSTPRDIGVKGEPLDHITGLGAAFSLRTPWSTILRADVGKSFLPDAFADTGSVVVQVLLLKPL